MDEREINAVAGRVGMPDGGHLWIGATKAKSVTSYEYPEIASPALAMPWEPAPLMRHHLLLPGRDFTQSRPEYLSVQLWEISGGAMWRWLFPRWNPHTNETFEGQDLDARRWEFVRVESIGQPMTNAAAPTAAC